MGLDSDLGLGLVPLEKQPPCAVAEEGGERWGGGGAVTFDFELFELKFMESKVWRSKGNNGVF